MTDKIIVLCVSSFFSMATVLVVTYFKGFITKTEFAKKYRPDLLVTKDDFNRHRLDYTKEKTEVRADLKHLIIGQNEIKGDIKTLIQKMGG